LYDNLLRLVMATSKTGSFWLTESVNTAGAVAAGTIDLGAYVDVGDQQALAIEQVDLIFQHFDTATGLYNSSLTAAIVGNATVDVQLSDNNPGGLFTIASDQNLIASGSVAIDDANNVYTAASDFYPDNFGKLDESRMVVNDQLYLVADLVGTAAPNQEITITARIKCRIVKLATKDWMAIAIQSTAADN